MGAPCDGLLTCYVKKSVAGPKEIFKPVYCPLTPIMDTTRARYSGLSRKLVVALDIGTTFSGAAYVLLDPGEVPQIQSITRYVFPPVPYPAAMVINEIQVPKHPEPRVRKNILHVVL